MVIPDETRYAEISREMVETGDWIVPQLNGLRYFEKPILGYWLNALSIKIFGENAFAIRLPSALSVGISAAILFFLVRSFTRDNIVAIMASSVFLTCLEVFAVGTFCVLDSVFSMFVTASMAAFFIAFMDVRSLKRSFFLFISGVSCGLAFLTKGFLAFIIAAIVLIPFSVWQCQLKKMLRLIWLPVIAAVLVMLPWSIMIYLREPDFWHYFFWVENIERFISPNGGQHPYPFWYFIPVIFIGMLPWTAQIISLTLKHRRSLFRFPLTRFCACWFIFPFLFFSISHGKLATYILPCFPSLIIFFVVALQQECNSKDNQKIDYSNRTGAVLILALIIVLMLTQIVIPKTKILGPNEIWKLFLIIIGLLAYMFILLYANKSTSCYSKFFFSIIAPLVFMFIVPFAIPDKFIKNKAPVSFLNQYKGRIDQNIILITDNYLTPAVCWCYKRTDVFLFERAGEFSYGLNYDDSSKHLLLDFDQLQELINKDLDRKNLILITSIKRYADYKQKLPNPFFENIEHGFVFAEFTKGKIHINQ